MISTDAPGHGLGHIHEEVECFRKTGFSADKCYEYTYATRRSFEYSAALGLNEWRYFTTNPFYYAGKWVRSESCGFGDGGDHWEVFLDDDGGEKIVSWDYDATLCFSLVHYSTPLRFAP